jgi:glyoxylase-like metal-dependent hydrolase (beta-lactamase superfamily II)
MAVTQLTEQLWRVEPAFGQCWIWRDGDEVTLIDSGPPGSAPVIAAALADLGLGTSAVARLVLTHFHVDHAGSANDVRGWGAEVLAHRGDAPVVRGAEPEPQPPLLPSEEELFAQVGGGASAPPCPVDRELDGGAELPFGGGAVVVHGPGHTPGSIGLHLPAAGVLFTGDTVAEFGGGLILGPFNLDRQAAAASFRLLASLDADIACFGHGEPVVGGAGERLRAVEDLGPFA